MLAFRPQDILDSSKVVGKLDDAFAQLFDGHCVCVELEAESGLVGKVAALRDVHACCGGRIQFPR